MSADQSDHYIVTRYDGNDFKLSRVTVYTKHPDPWKEIKSQFKDDQVVSAVRISTPAGFDDDAIQCFDANGQRIRHI